MNNLSTIDSSIDLDAILFSCGIVADYENYQEEIEMDSLSFVSLIIEIENKTKKTVPEELMSINKWDTIGKIKNSIEKLLGS